MGGNRRWDRLEAFESMLREIVTQSEEEKRRMDELKKCGKEKTATYRQYLGNRLLHQQMLDLYKKYELVD